MKHIYYRLKFAVAFCVMLFMCVTNIYSQRTWSSSSYVKIDINSGNPAFPFPQFLEYEAGKTLAKYNAEGVTHADMEKTMREAYEIMSHRCRYEGGTHCGVPYITFNDFVKLGKDELPQGAAEFCSEGDGYILLASAIFADQPTFNGLWMWIHDNRLSKVKKYKDGTWLRKGMGDPSVRMQCKDPEAGGNLAGWNVFDDAAAGSSPSHSAADGDYDIAMGLLIAYKQWGEFMYQDGKQVLDSEGNPISYKKAAQDYIKALVDTIPYYQANGGQNGYLTGDIGVDGYPKGGNSWGELTNWRATQTMFGPELCQFPSMGGGGGTVSYCDYNAPSYFNEFAHWLENEDGEGTPWQITQFKRAEASSDWIAGQLYAQGGIASVGKAGVNDDGSQVQFTPFNAGEDFRFAWRHILNYLWHGNPKTTWNPKTHAVEAGGNTFEYDLAIRHAEFMKDPAGKCAKMGASPDPGQPSWSGPAQIRQSYFMDGTIQEASGSNYALGCSAPAAVASEDLDFIADMYRQSELVWDDASAESKNLTDEERDVMGMPKYFHGWFRCLGLLTNSGNMHAPRNMKPIANMKVYMSVDKTYAYVDDKIDYTVQYRNYGTLEAEGVTITTAIDPSYEVVKISNGGKFANGKIVWNIGSVPGFKSGHLAETIDFVSFTVRAKDTKNPRICLTSTISGSNFPDWVSNEYPNHATYTMERNCVDILASRTLQVKKTASRDKLNPGSKVTFTVDLENKSEGEDSWMNGGRDNVRISYGNYYMPGSAYQFYQLYRFWNDSYEAYINMNNYRVSYFMSDAAAIGLFDEAKNPTGWTFVVDNQNDLDKYGYNPEDGPITFAYQKMPVGSDENGKWNQRLMIRFANTLMAPSTHVYDKLDSKYLLHKGVFGPGFIRARLASNPNTDLTQRVQDDWSFDTKVTETSLDGQGTTFTLVTPCWAKYNEEGVVEPYEITNYSRHACSPAPDFLYDRVLVEEFDGYTWRRIQGRGPVPGREAYNVTIIDTIPYELEWDGWIDSTALKDDAGVKIQATYTPATNPKNAGYTGIVKWTTPVMLVGEKDKLIYVCKARDLGCPDAEDTYYYNVAWISSDTDSPDSSRVELMTSCAELPPVIDPQESLFKTANKKKAMVGDEVSYEIKFINTKGTDIDANCTKPKEWITLGNKYMPDQGTKIPGMVLSKENGAFFAPTYAYGKDCDIYATIQGADNTDVFFVARYQSGIPGKPDFKGVAMKLKINLSGKNNFGYELYNDGQKIDAQGTGWSDAMQFGGNHEYITFRFVLSDNLLTLQINDEENEWTSPFYDNDKITSKGPGYVGFYTERNNGAPTLTKFIGNVDYAFNVTIGDNLPKELEEITDMTSNGEYNESTHTIKWPTIATTTKEGIAPGDSVVYNFDARVKECNKFISNLGWATVYGMDSLKVVNTIECGEEVVVCDIDDAEIKISANEICEGDSVSIRVIPTPKSKDYEYAFYKDKEKTPLDTKSASLDSIFVKEAGSYYAIVSNPQIAGCEVQTKAVKLAVNEIPTAKLSEDTTLCEGLDLSLAKQGVSGYKINWYKDAIGSIDLEDVEIASKDILKAYYYTLEDETTGCVSEIEKFTVVKEAIPAAPTPKDGEYSVLAGAKQDITDHATPPVGAHILWYESETATDSLKAPIKVSVDKEDKFDFYVSAVSDGGCESERVKIHIEVTSSNKPKTRDTVLCIGEEVDVESLVTIEAGATSNWVDENGGEVAAPGTYTASAPGEQKYYVSQTVGVATSDVAEITITTLGVGGVTVEDVELCENETASPLSVSKDNSTVSQFVKLDAETSYEWYLSGVKLDAADLTPKTNVTATKTDEYKIVPVYTIAKGHICKGDSATLKVTITRVDAPEINNSINYTLQDTTDSGVFDDLLEHDEGAITAAHTLIWYDENEKLIGETAPTPAVDRTMTDDVTYTYWVSQKNDKGCESAKSKVTVIVSMTPVPKPSDANFCEDEATSKLLSDYVKTTDDTYTLVWYDKDPKQGGAEISMPSISTALVEDTTEQVTTYFVAQTKDGSTSSAVKVEVHIYAKPTLITHDTTVCSKAVDLNTCWSVSEKVTNTIHTEFTDESNITVTAPGSVGLSGIYNVEGYFEVPVTKAECRSEKEHIKVEIHKIEDVEISGATSVCPGATVELKASVGSTSETFGSTLTYTWDKNNNSSKDADGEFESDALSSTTSFVVSVSDGVCKDIKSQPHEVTIGAGEVSGTFSFTDDGKSPEVEVVNGKPLAFNTCGGEFTLNATQLDKTAGTSFKWQDANNDDVTDASDPNVLRTDKAGTYTAVYTNKCETSLTITISDASIKDNTIPADKQLCENYNATLTLDFESATKSDIVWEKDGEKLDETSKVLSITKAKTGDEGVYTYRISNRDCEIKGTYGTVKVSPAPTYDILPVDVICAGTSVAIGIENLSPATATVKWAEDETLVVAGNQSVATPTENKTYTLSIEQSGGCMVTENIKVTVVDPISFDILPEDTAICVGSPDVRLRLKGIVGDVLTYSWTDGEGTEVSSTTSYKAPASKVGETTYTVTLTSEACPPESKKIVVEVVGIPLIDTFINKKYKDVEFVPKEDSGSGSYEYCIDGKDYQSDAKFDKVSFGKHTATIRDQYGCKSNYDFEIIAPELDIPVVVTPNGDGDNDAFISEVLSEAYPNAKVTIYDRRGKVVAKIPASEGWDGTYNGHRMPSTDYWYEIWVEELRKTYVGHFTLIND